MSTESASKLSFDFDAAWELHPQVAVRPERFGALLYHFGNRQLSFLKSRVLLTLVHELGGNVTARSACAAAGLTVEDLPKFAGALAALADSRMICRREGA